MLKIKASKVMCVMIALIVTMSISSSTLTQAQSMEELTVLTKNREVITIRYTEGADVIVLLESLDLSSAESVFESLSALNTVKPQRLRGPFCCRPDYYTRTSVFEVHFNARPGFQCQFVVYTQDICVYCDAVWYEDAVQYTHIH